MNSLLTKLIGLQIESVDYNQGYLILKLSDQVGMTVMSNFSIKNLSDIKELVNLEVENVIETATIIEFKFTNGSSLIVDLTEGARHGMEVLTLQFPNQPLIVVD